MSKNISRQNNTNTYFTNCRHTQCYVFRYVFQDTLMKTLFQPDFTSVTLLLYRQKYYLITPPFAIAPVLIDQPTQDGLQRDDFCLTQSHIKAILTNEPNIQLPFSVVLHSAYKFRVSKTIRKINPLILGLYTQPNSSIYWHVFLSPLISETPSLKLNFLQESGEHRNMCYLKNYYSTSHHTEGALKTERQSINQETLLNQDFCLCDNIETNPFFVPTIHQFKNLGKTN